MTAVSKTIQPNNAYLVRTKVTQWSSTTDTYVPWTGLNSMRAGFYEDALGATGISGLTNLTMAEVTGTGVYYVVVSAALTAILGTSFDGDVIYQIVTGGASNELKVVTPLMVSQPRYAEPGE